MTLVTTASAANADSYGSLAATATYFSSRGITTWTGSDVVKENALRRATNYLDNQYRNRWIGIRSTQTQSLAWPRLDGSRNPWHETLLIPLLDLDGFEIPIDAVPQQIITATFEAALLALTGVSLEPRLTPEDFAKSRSEQVGPISETIVYSESGPSVDRHMVIEGILRGLVKSTPGASSGTVSIVRA